MVPSLGSEDFPAVASTPAVGFDVVATILDGDEKEKIEDNSDETVAAGDGGWVGLIAGDDASAARAVRVVAVGGGVCVVDDAVAASTVVGVVPTVVLPAVARGVGVSVFLPVLSVLPPLLNTVANCACVRREPKVDMDDVVMEAVVDVSDVVVETVFGVDGVVVVSAVGVGEMAVGAATSVGDVVVVEGDRVGSRTVVLDFLGSARSVHGEGRS